MAVAVDIIISADHVLTMDAGLALFEKGAVAIDKGIIVDVGPATDIFGKYTAFRTIEGSNKVLFPGLVNTHTHAAMVYFRGLADDLPLKVWLEEHIWPAEGRWLSPEFVGDAVELACLEMLMSGITTYNDMYFFGDAIAESTKGLGMRAVVGAGIFDFPSKAASSIDEYLAKAEDFIVRWIGDDLITPNIAPHSLYTCAPQTLTRAKKLADKHDVFLNLHLSETQWEVQEIVTRYGKRPIGLLDDIGLLDERLIAAHCVWASDDEIDLLAKRTVGVSHCIESNLKLASGIAPVSKMLKAGVKVTFGTDGAASNNDLDILSEMSTAAKIHKTVSCDPTSLSAKQAMLMATRWAAEATGLGRITGSIEKGKAADLVLASLDRPHLTPIYDIYSHIVYSMNSSDIETVLVSGSVIVENRRLQTADEKEIMEKAREWGVRIREKNTHS